MTVAPSSRKRWELDVCHLWCFVMELYSIEYIRGCRRGLHALTVARVVVIERTVTL